MVCDGVCENDCCNPASFTMKLLTGKGVITADVCKSHSYIFKNLGYVIVNGDDRN